MIKTYRARFAGIYDGLRFKNQVYMTDDSEIQKKIESSPYFINGEVVLMNSSKNLQEAPESLESINDMPMYALRKKASQMGLKVNPKTKKNEIIEMIQS